MKNLIGLTLFNALKLVKCNVKIGASNGSGYVYCGKPDVMKLHEADAVCVEADERRVALARKKLDQLIAEWLICRNELMQQLQIYIQKRTTASTELTF